MPNYALTKSITEVKQEVLKAMKGRFTARDIVKALGGTDPSKYSVALHALKEEGSIQVLGKTKIRDKKNRWVLVTVYEKSPVITN